MHIEYVKKRGNAEQTIYQGQISFGSHTQSTGLGSCICLILFSEKLKIGGLSHIVGHKTNIGPYNFPDDVIKQFQAHQARDGIKDPGYFIIGGSDPCAGILGTVEGELQKNNMKYALIDVLGRYHRQVILFPKESKITIYKETLGTYS